MKLVSATGNGDFGLEINEENRALASAVTSTECEHNTDKGNSFTINTGDITLTDATETTLLYILNESDDPIFIPRINLYPGASTGGTGDIVLSIIKSPASGAIITNANNCDIISNQNHGSFKPFVGKAYKGATAEAPTAGTTTSSTRYSTFVDTKPVSDNLIILPKGTSLAVNYTPPASNTSQTVQVSTTVFFQDIVV